MRPILQESRDKGIGGNREGSGGRGGGRGTLKSDRRTKREEKGARKTGSERVSE